MLDKTTPPPLPNSAMVNNHNAEANFGILDWFKKALRNYTNFSGRARRKEYWYFVLVQMGLIIVAMILDAIIFNSETGLFYIVVALGLFLPGLAVTIRRLHDTSRSGWWHDTSRSGWWFLLSILPLIGSIVLLVFLASDTKLETNQWGPPAK